MTLQPTPSFKENLSLMPAIDGVAHINIVSDEGVIVGVIENKPGKQGSLAVYLYLQQTFGVLNSEAATFGIALFAEHAADARLNPGAHPNIDRLFAILEENSSLKMELVAA